MADHGGFEYRVVRDERGLDFGGRDPDAGDFQHVVGAAAIGVEAVRVLAVLIAAARPLADEGGAALGAVVPVKVGGGRALDQQLAQLALLHFAALLVDQFQLVARHRLAGGAVAEFARPVGKEDVQHLGRADAVEDIDTGLLLEALGDLRREGFTRGNTGF